MNSGENQELVTVGRITSVYGVKGWVKIHSYTEPLENVMLYQPWQLFINKRNVVVEIDAFKRHGGNGLVAHIVGCDDRDKARAYTSADINVPRQQLPLPEAGEYYWHQLQGLTVITDTGVTLGKVDYLMETGSNDVMMVKGEDRQRLIPYLPDQVIKQIDLDKGVITVDWDPEF